VSKKLESTERSVYMWDVYEVHWLAVGELYMVRKIIRNAAERNRLRFYGLDPSGSEYAVKAGSCEHGNESRVP
jgi:hypothetical protein